MENFITTLSWIFGTLSTMLLIIRVLGKMTYSSDDRLYDLLRGKVKTFPITVPGTISIICLVWVWTV